MTCPAPETRPTFAPRPHGAVVTGSPFQLDASCAPLRACADLHRNPSSRRSPYLARCFVWAFMNGHVAASGLLSVATVCRPGVVRCRCTDGACLACDDHGWLWPVDGGVAS